MITNKKLLNQLGDIAVFVCVVEEGAFTAAAKKLKISKAVVSKYVSRLEDQLGVQLLQRSTRRLSLTEVGRVFYEEVLGGLKTIERAEGLVADHLGKPRGTLRVNCPMSFGILHLAPAVREFREHCPDVYLDLHFDDRKRNLIEDRFDLTIRLTTELEPTTIARRLTTIRNVLVASPAYLARKGTPRTPAELSKHDVITYAYQYSPREWELFKEDGSSVKIPVADAVQMNNSLAVREAVLAGEGITRTPSFIVGKDIQEGALCEVLAGYEHFVAHMFVVVPESHRMPPKTRAFIEFLAKRFSDPPYWDQI